MNIFRDFIDWTRGRPKGGTTVRHESPAVIVNVIDEMHVHGDPATQAALQRIEEFLVTLQEAVARVAAAYASLAALLDAALADDADAAVIKAERDRLAGDAAQAIADLANIAPAPGEVVDPGDVPLP